MIAEPESSRNSLLNSLAMVFQTGRDAIETVGKTDNTEILAPTTSRPQQLAI